MYRWGYWDADDSYNWVLVDTVNGDEYEVGPYDGNGVYSVTDNREYDGE